MPEPYMTPNEAHVLELCVTQIVRDRFGAADVTLERRASSNQSSFRLEEMDLRLEDGTRIELVFKDVGRRGLLKPAADAKPPFLHDPRREITCYAHILQGDEWGTPRYYGSLVDADAARYWLFLERVRGVRLIEEDDLTGLSAAARWLARLHAAFHESRTRLAAQAPLIQYDAQMYSVWMTRALAFAARRGQVDARDALERISRRYDEVVDCLLRLPATFIHGEFYPGNVLIRDRTRTPCVLDWEMAAIGPGLLDVAALSTGKWTADQRQTLVPTYVEACRQVGYEPAAPIAMSTALACCRLHLAMRWLGWSADWAPPSDEAFNWLSEAEDAVRVLGL